MSVYREMALRRAGLSTEECVLCDGVLDDAYGHNPSPCADEGRCCNSCNANQVIPARMYLYHMLKIDENTVGGYDNRKQGGEDE